jgi:Uncharacterised nucleotidyltransferase
VRSRRIAPLQPNLNLSYDARMPLPDTSVDALLHGVDEFFMSQGPVHQTMRSLAQSLTQEGIDYAVVGGMALVLQGYRRETIDVDVLLSKEGHRRFMENLVGHGYARLFPGEKKRFRDVETGVEIDIITQGEYPGDGKPKPVSFPEPSLASIEIDGIRLVTLEKLVELKLASGMTAPDRLRDLADVQELIKLRKLDAEYAERLDPYVRHKYLELWNAVASTTAEERPGAESGPDE